MKGDEPSEHLKPDERNHQRRECQMKELHRRAASYNTAGIRRHQMPEKLLRELGRGEIRKNQRDQRSYPAKALSCIRRRGLHKKRHLNIEKKKGERNMDEKMVKSQS